MLLILNKIVKILLWEKMGNKRDWNRITYFTITFEIGIYGFIDFVTASIRSEVNMSEQ